MYFHLIYKTLYVGVWELQYSESQICHRLAALNFNQKEKVQVAVQMMTMSLLNHIDARSHSSSVRVKPSYQHLVNVKMFFRLSEYLPLYTSYCV